MKKLILAFSVFILSYSSNAQCPVNMYAIDVTFITQGASPDTSCTIMAGNFPANSKVYIYDNSSQFVDSITTDAGGFGIVSLPASKCMVSSTSTVGTAAVGSCSTPVIAVKVLPIKLTSFTATSFNNNIKLNWATENDIPGTLFEIEESADGVNYKTVHSIRSTTQSSGSQQYQYILSENITGKEFYRIKITEPGASVKYSEIRTVSAQGYSGLLIYPTVASRQFSASLSADYINGRLKVYNNTGAMVYSAAITQADLKVSANWNKGVYYVRAISPEGRTSLKTVVIQ